MIDRITGLGAEMNEKSIPSLGVAPSWKQEEVRNAAIPKHRSQVGYWVSRKTRSAHRHESLLEKHGLLVMEFDERVLWYRTQPFTLVFETPENSKTRHTPDFLIRTADGDVIVDVKNTQHLTYQRIVQKLRDVSHEFRRLGTRYTVIDDSVICAEPRFENVKTLGHFLHWDIHPNIVKAAKHFVANESSPTLGALLNYIDQSYNFEICQSKVSLANHGYILLAQGCFSFDINLPIDLSLEIKRRSVASC